MNSLSKRAFSAAVITFLAAWCCTPSLQAAIIGKTTYLKDPLNGVPFASPEGALGAPWVSLRLDVEATAGELIGAVDVNVTGPLHQRWTDADEDGIFDPTPNANSAASLTQGDSHLIALPGALFGRGPSEDNSGTGSPLADTLTRNYGIGTFLDGAWGIQNATGTASLAYLVVPSNQLHLVDISVKVANPLGDIIAEIDSPLCFDCGPRFSGTVSGNGVTIPNGDHTPSEFDHTDFGSVPVGSLQQRTYTISNPSGVTWPLGPATFTGPFSLIGSFPESVGATPVTFTVGLDTSAPGNFLGGVSFLTHPAGVMYIFDLAARVVPEPSAALLVCSVFVGCGVFGRVRRT